MSMLCRLVVYIGWHVFCLSVCLTVLFDE